MNIQKAVRIVIISAIFVSVLAVAAGGVSLAISIVCGILQ